MSCIKFIQYILLCVKYLPILVIFYVNENEQLTKDMIHYSKYFGFRRNNYFTLAYLFEKIPEFRNIFFFRYNKVSFLRKVYKGVNNLYFFTSAKNIGGGLLFWHGFSTAINAISIGENCEIWQNVTIGKKSTDKIPDKPTIGDNVRICANSVVIGPIKIGNNVIIGAGTVVTKDIPDDSIVVGNPARILNNK